MSINETEYETPTVTYGLLQRFIDPQIAKDYADLEFKDKQSRENAETTLSSLTDDFFPHLFKTGIIQTNNPSILYSYQKFQKFEKGLNINKKKLILERVLKLNLVYRIFGHTRSIYCLLFDQTNQLLFTGSEDSHIKVWHYPSYSLIYTLRGHEEGVIKIALSPDKKLLASISTDQSLRFWNLKNGAAVAMIYSSEYGNLTDISFSPCGRFFSVGSQTGLIRIFTISNLIPELLNIEKNILKNIFFGETISYYNSYDPMNFIHKLPSTRKVLNYKEPISVLSFSPGGNFLVSCLENGILNIYTMNNTRNWKIQAHDSFIDGCIFSKNNFHLFFTWSNRGGDIKFWNFFEKIELIRSFSVRFQQRRSNIVHISLSCDESFIVAITTQMIFVWSINNNTPILHVEDLTNLTYVSFHPKIPSIFFVCMKQKISIFDVFNKNPIRNLDVPFETPKINKAIWSLDGMSIVSSDLGGGYYIFKPNEIAICKQSPFFYPTDFRISEWVSDRGQVDDKTGILTHEQSRNIIIDSDKINLCTNYIPINLEENWNEAIFPNEIKNNWYLEEIWLKNIKENKDKKTEEIDLSIIEEQTNNKSSNMEDNIIEEEEEEEED